MDFNIYFCGNQNTIAMSTYINSMTDFGFKYIFGREESKMEIMPFIQKDRLFRRLSSVASYANLSDEDKMDYDADLKAYRDIVGQLSYAKAEEREEGKAEMIVNLVKAGLPIEQIAVIANMAIDKVRKILGNM